MIPVEKEGDDPILFGAKSCNANVEAAWEALKQHGRAGVGRPRKDSPRPTLAQLGLTKMDGSARPRPRGGGSDR